LFISLREADKLEGKCGECEFREVCGGSRARSYAMTGNMFAEEPCCVYLPGKATRKAESNSLNAPA
jgi:AdoMet-dependent heme synthase